MKKILKKLLLLLDKKQKSKMILIVLLMLVGGALETLGVSLILPVMNVVLEENAVSKHVYLQWICNMFGIQYEDTKALMIVVMLGLILVFILKNLFLFFQQKGSKYEILVR